jgi:hypothetical protein
MRSRREEVENKWRKIFSEMMETALRHSNFIDTASVVVNYALKLGFERAHLFWAPKRDETAQRSAFVGIDCSGSGCTPSFTKVKFRLQDLNAFQNLLLSRDSIYIETNGENKKIISEIASVGFLLPVNGWWMLPLWSGTELLGILMLDFGQTCVYLSTHERTLLDFFSRQVAITLEHARMYSWRKRPLTVFLCHSKEDKEKVRELYNLLALQPGIVPWFDEENLLPGVEWNLEIEQAVKSSDVVIVCLSTKSLSKDGYIHKEIRLALDTAERKPEGTIYIIPLMLEECIVPERLNKWQWMDYFNNSQEKFNKLIESLRKQSRLLDRRED